MALPTTDDLSGLGFSSLGDPFSGGESGNNETGNLDYSLLGDPYFGNPAPSAGNGLPTVADLVGLGFSVLGDPFIGGELDGVDTLALDYSLLGDPFVGNPSAPVVASEKFWNPPTDANYADTGAWALADGGDPTGVPPPTSADKVHFTAMNHNKCTVDSAVECEDLDFTGFTGEFTGDGFISCYGNINWGTTMLDTFIGSISTKKTSGTQTLKTNGAIMWAIIASDGLGGTLQLSDPLVTWRAFYVLDGSFDSNGQDLTTQGAFVCPSSNGTVDISGSTIDCYQWLYNSSVAPVFAGSKIIVRGNLVKFEGNGHEYNDLEFIGGLNYTLEDVGNTFADFKAPAGATITMPNGNTTVVGFDVDGTGGSHTTLQRTGASGAWTLSCSSGIITIKNCNISNSYAVGGATFNSLVSDGNLNYGNNHGWIWNAHTDNSVVVGMNF